jgi:hypothetical protein
MLQENQDRFDSYTEANELARELAGTVRMPITDFSDATVPDDPLLRITSIALAYTLKSDSKSLQSSDLRH